jgi:hypothetical protein
MSVAGFFNWESLKDGLNFEQRSRKGLNFNLPSNKLVRTGREN